MQAGAIKAELLELFCVQPAVLGSDIAGAFSGSDKDTDMASSKSDIDTDGASSLEDSSSHVQGMSPVSIPAIAQSKELDFVWATFAPDTERLELLAAPPKVSGTAHEKPRSEHSNDSSETARLSSSSGGGSGDARMPSRVSESPRRNEDDSDIEDELECNDAWSLSICTNNLHACDRLHMFRRESRCKQP